MKNKTTSEFDAQGHRGCRALMPENTIPAMLTALDLGVTTLELDVVITKDKQVLVSHEPFFNHEITTKPNGDHVTEMEEKSLNIYTMTYDETRHYDVGLKPHPRFRLQKKMRVSKPLLSELIDSVEAYCRDKKLKPPFYNIETKCLPETDNIYHPPPQQFVQILMTLLESKNLSNRLIIQSFDVRTLKALQAMKQQVSTALLIDEDNKFSYDHNIKSLGFIPTIYSPHYSLVSAQLVEQCHQQGVRIIPWTVNDKSTMTALKKHGVDGIISDDPRLFH